MQAIPRSRFVRFVTATLALTSVCVPAGLFGQEQETRPEVTEGRRVRVTHDMGRSVGRLVHLSGDSLVVVTDDNDQIRFRSDQIQRVELSGGKHRNAQQGLLIGSAAGLAVGVVAALTLPERGCSSFSGYCAGDEALAVVGNTLSGAGLGALIGVFVKSERWQEGSLPDLEPMVTLQPQGDHRMTLGIGLRLRI